MEFHNLCRARRAGDALGEEILCTDCLSKELLLRTGTARLFSSLTHIKGTEFILSMGLSRTWLPEDFGAPMQDLLVWLLSTAMRDQPVM